MDVFRRDAGGSRRRRRACRRDSQTRPGSRQRWRGRDPLRRAHTHDPRRLPAVAVAAATDAVVGAGTVLEVEQARRAVEAGARFIVSPACLPELGPACCELSVPLFLGAYTPTEVVAARRAGATAIKLFPAAVGGPAYLKQLRGPFPDVRFLTSGRIDERTAHTYPEAGAVAVYTGSSRVPPHLVAGGNDDEIARRAHAFVAALS